MSGLVTLLLTCAHQQEADAITHALLYNKLAACVNATPVTSQFLWQGTIDHASEVLLIIHGLEAQIPAIEAAVRGIHSYSTFVLLALPVVYASNGVKEWMTESCKI